MIIFAYNFEHKKTNDIILECYRNNIAITLIIAQNKKELRIAKLPFSYRHSEATTVHPKDLAKELQIDYLVCDHNSTEAIKILNALKPKIGIVAGARILSNGVIDQFSIGIINFHPGDLPLIRGLHSILRAIKKRHKIVVTAHLIDSKIDAGNTIHKIVIPVYHDDSVNDVSDRAYAAEITLLRDSIEKALDHQFEPMEIAAGSYDYQVPFNSLQELEESFKLYKDKFV